MTKSQTYLEKVVIAVNATAEPAIAAALADRCGYAAADYAAITAKIEPARAALRQMDAAASALEQATANFTTNLAALKKDLPSLRRVMSNNLPRNSPLFKKLGLNAAPPKAQEALLAYAENAFTQGKDLLPAESALLTQRKWDTARFTAALANVTATRAANQKQESGKGESLAATAKFYDAIDALDELFRPFAKNARSNLADIPGALEKMGLQSRIPAKPQRPLPAAARKKTTPPTPAAS
jgi:cell pole-organizing protein PopZ